MADLVLKDEVFAIIGAAMEVHTELGSGFHEAVYHEALAHEFNDRSIPFESEKRLTIRYKNHILQKEYFADIVCFEQILSELKSLNNLTTKEESQILNYLKASQLPVGLLINFGSIGRLERKRFVY